MVLHSVFAGGSALPAQSRRTRRGGLCPWIGPPLALGRRWICFEGRTLMFHVGQLVVTICDWTPRAFPVPKRGVV